jgi:hypothetical protein
MDIADILKHVAPFRTVILIVVVLLVLAQYYIAFEAFMYAAKKEDSPANINASWVKGAITFFLGIAFTVFLVWLYFQKW